MNHIFKLRTMKHKPAKLGISSFRVLNLAYCLATLLLFSACDDNEDYYERPSWLEPLIYEVLKEKGNFSMYLEAVDRTLYSSVLKGTGSYTVFAPNDGAFQKFLLERGYNSIQDIPVEELTKIVGYSMIYNKFESTQLGSVWASSWYNGVSIKKKTPYYQTIYKEVVNGEERWIVDSPADLTTVATPYKYLPIITQDYFNQNELKSDDYKAFYPDVDFVGLNVLGARILTGTGQSTSHMYAENGIVYEVDAVSYPLENLDEMMRREENNTFYDIMTAKVGSSYLFVSYTLGQEATEIYKRLYPDRNIDAVYYKTYTGLPFLPNNEQYSGVHSTSSDGRAATTEEQGYTMLIPSKQAMTDFTTTLKNRTGIANLSDLSQELLTYFLQAHMVDGIVWPSQFKAAKNANNEFLNGEGINGKDFANSGITKSEFASNGIMYNVDHVIENKYFNTVYSEILLNPDCKELTRYAFKNLLSTLVAEITRSRIDGFPDENYTILLPTDELLAGDGYTYNTSTSKFANELLLGSITADDRLKRLIQMCVFKRTKNQGNDTSLENFSGSPSLGYDDYGFAVNSYGDMIRFKDNKLQAFGNIQDNKEVKIVKKIDFPYINGQVFIIDELPQFSPRATNPGTAIGWSDKTLYECITNYVNQNSDASKFKQYIDILYPDGTITDINTSAFYTILAPQNDVIDQAVLDGYLPALSDVTSSETNKAMTTRFINTCFLAGMVLADDGIANIEPGNLDKAGLTTNFKINNQRIYVDVTKSGGMLKFTPRSISGVAEGIGEAAVIRQTGKSNYMGSKLVIHAVNRYITFKVN